MNEKHTAAWGLKLYHNFCKTRVDRKIKLLIIELDFFVKRLADWTKLYDNLINIFYDFNPETSKNLCVFTHGKNAKIVSADPKCS